MRPISGMRPPLAKLVLAAERLKEVGEIYYNYVLDIASYYVSEVKTKEDIVCQFRADIELMIQQYLLAKRLSGNDEELNREYKTYGITDICVIKDFEKTMRTISVALELLIREAANQKVFIDIETLESLGLRNIKSEIILYKSHSLMDSVFTQYKIHGYIKPVPEWTDKVRQCFQRRKHYEDFYSKCIGCSPYEIADNYYNLPMDYKFLNGFNRFQALYDYFIDPSLDMPSYIDFRAFGNPITPRQFRNIMKAAKDRVLIKQA